MNSEEFEMISNYAKPMQYLAIASSLFLVSCGGGGSSSGGAVATYCGMPVGGTPTLSQLSTSVLNSPQGIATDNGCNVYVADQNSNNILIIPISGGAAKVFAGTGSAGNVDSSNGPPQFNGPTGITLDKSGNVYVADTNNNSIRMITPKGVVSTLANGFSAPTGITTDGTNVYVADTSNNAVTKVAIIGGAKTVLSSGFINPTGVAVDSNFVYVANNGNSTIDKIPVSGGAPVTVAGTSLTPGFTDSPPLFNAPQGVTLGSNGNLYVVDSGNQTIRRITSSGTVSTIAGNRNTTFIPGPISGTTGLSNPFGITAIGGWLFITDANIVVEINNAP
jgi:hypothetical protein